MERIPDELLSKIMEIACDEPQIDEPQTHVMGFQSSFTQGRDLEWCLEDSEPTLEGVDSPKVARVMDTFEIHKERLRRSMVTKRVSS